MSGSAIRFVVALLIAGAVALTATMVVAEITFEEEAMQQYHAEVEAYCGQSYPEGAEFKVYNAMVVGHHGGIHCSSYEHGVIHIHDVTDKALAVAYAAEQRGDRVDWSEVDRYKPWHERAGWADVKLFGFVLGMVFVVVIPVRWMVNE